VRQKVMNSCNIFTNYLENHLEELLEFFIYSQDTNLKPKDILNFKNHLNNCPGCYQTFKQYQEIKTTIKNLPKNQLPVNFHLQVSKAIYALPEKKPFSLILEFSFKNLALAFSVVLLFIFSLSLIKFNNTQKPTTLTKQVSSNYKFQNSYKLKKLPVPLTLKNSQQQKALININKQVAVIKQKLNIKSVQYKQRKNFFKNKNKKHFYWASWTRKFKMQTTQTYAGGSKFKINKDKQDYEFALAFSAKNLNPSLPVNSMQTEKNNLQIELTLADDAYFTGENKTSKSKKIIFNSEVQDSIPQITIIPIISKNKTINIKGKITSNGNFVEFNKILKAPKENNKTNNNNTNLEVLSFVPSQKETIKSENIKNLKLTIASGEVQILPVDEKNFSVISDNFGETKVVLADGESISLNKVQIINKNCSD